jgi:hypothetical protein
MKTEVQMKFCTVCKNRTFSPKYGIICGLTNDLPTFESSCETYVEDKKEVSLQKENQNRLKEETNKPIRNARVSLFVIGGFYIIVGFLEAFILDFSDILFGIIDWILAAIFIGLGFLSYQKTSLALIIGLSIYGGIMLLLLALEPTTVFKGIIWKGLIIYYLIVGIKTSRTEEAKMIASGKNDDLLDDF